jgi:lysophospholipase L1-like esterase
MYVPFVALGDSITYGEGASGPCKSYPSVLARLFRESRKARLSTGDILAEPGWTSAALQAAVTSTGSQTLSRACVVVIWIGGDDLAQAALTLAQIRGAAPSRYIERSIRQYSVHLGQLLPYIHRVSRAPIFVCTQYNPFPNTAIARAGVEALNEATAFVAGRKGATIVPTASWFEGRQSSLIAGYRHGTIQDALLPPLPIHPNDAGHHLIAEGLYRTMAPMLRV